jgi:hypothetical protein
MEGAVCAVKWPVDDELQWKFLFAEKGASY